MLRKTVLSFSLAAILLCGSVYAQNTPFYQGKTIKVVAGTTTRGPERLTVVCDRGAFL